jgi:hypothetical protein
MTDKVPADWVLIEAAKRSFWDTPLHSLRVDYPHTQESFRALCDMIEKYEQPPVDRKLLCAREAVREWEHSELLPTTEVVIRAIELWEEGFGR